MMKHRFFRSCCGLLLTAAICLVPRASEAQRFKWWQDETVQRKLALSRDQIRHIEDIFRGTMPELGRAKHELDRLERELMPFADGSSDDAALKQHVDRVETARAELNKKRSLMLLRMRRVLHPEQRVKLEALDRERRAASDKHDKRH